jgi:hypothetical protein
MNDIKGIRIEDKTFSTSLFRFAGIVGIGRLGR